MILDVYPSSNTSQCYEQIIEPSDILQMDEKSLISQQFHILQRPFENGDFNEQMYRTKQIVNRYNVTNQLYILKYAKTQLPQPFKIIQIPNTDEKIMCRRDGYLTSLLFDNHQSTILYSTGFVNLLDCVYVEENGVDTIIVVGIQNIEGGAATATIMKIDWRNSASRSTTLFTLHTFDTTYFASFIGKIMLTKTQSMVILVGSTTEDILRLYHVTYSFVFYVGTIIDLQQYLPRTYKPPLLSNQLELPCQIFQNNTITLYTVVMEEYRSIAILEIKGEDKGSFSVSRVLPILDIPRNESSISNIFLLNNNANLLAVSYANSTRYVSHIYADTSSNNMLKYETRAFGMKDIANIINLKQVHFCNVFDTIFLMEIRERSIQTFTITTKNLYPELVNDIKRFESDWRPDKIDGKKIQVLDLVFDSDNSTYISSNSSSVADIRYEIDNADIGIKASVIHLLRIDFDVKSFTIRAINSLSIVYYNLPSSVTKDLSSFFPYSNNTIVFTINTVNNTVEYTELFEFDTFAWIQNVRKEFNDISTDDTMYIFDDHLYLTNSTTGALVTNLENYKIQYITFPNLTQIDPLDKTVKISTVLHKNMSEYLETVPKPVFPHEQYMFFATSRGYIYQMSMEGLNSQIITENTIFVGNSSWIPMSGLFFNLHLYLTFYPGHILDIEYKEIFLNGKYQLYPYKKEFYELAFLNDISMGKKSTMWTAQLDCYAEYTYFTGDKEAIYKLEMRNVPLSLYDIESVNINNIADMKASDNSGMLYLIDYNGNILIRDISLYPDVRFYLVIAVISLLGITLLVVSIVCIIPVIMRYRRRKLIFEKRKTFRELVKNKTTNTKFILERRLYVVDPYILFVKKKYFAPDIITHRSVGPHGIMFEATIHNSPVMLKKITTSLKVYRQDLEEEAMKLVSIRHKNVQKYVGLSVDDQNNKYIVYEKLPDFEGSLRDYIDYGILKHQTISEEKISTYEKFSISFQEKLVLLRDTINGLQYLHKKGITMWGNLKPSNILIHFVEPEETTNTIQEHLDKSYLTSSQANFISGRNVAKITDYAFLHYCKGVIYKPEDLIYTSPEALENETSKSEASVDIYSFALVMFALIFMISPCEDVPSINTSKPSIPFDSNNDEAVWEWFSNSYSNDDYLGMLNYNILNHDNTKVKQTTIKNIKKIVSMIEKMWSSDPSSRPSIREVIELFKEVIV
ncbi:predicted protein [Naegleria gruberi]|uniref:Predicted protein n=1 Tax=Naegleria gruberi TaxID=5762 RepID=D2UY32_NAEGR|nr:uncharacterized protein NAEGRDRAFT_45081 [Naegleria gruberi]EFC50402.1 predicted protein [Naegleria gruberi]|eukprot:XP_002683146.1 predicted protein [Naegleria gruberi strain NEG-M]